MANYGYKQTPRCATATIGTMAISYKRTVVFYARQHGNRAAERMFGPPLTEKIIRSWRKQEDDLKVVSRQKTRYRVCGGVLVKWPELEEELKNCVVNNRSSGLCVSTKIIIHHAKGIAERLR
ncbi:unnamed protein product [Meganyctiphanes norvegica]|uniref:Transposase n=1 Tax=Meganyctiphanes norvegica TaxID=48144 RepID=A0AAV2S8V5_MEGNR